MARSEYRSMREIEEKMEFVQACRDEQAKLRITDPDSPRIPELEEQAASALGSARLQAERVQEEVREAQAGIDRFGRLSFDVQRQVATLSATLIVALLALSEVFEGTPGLRAAVGDASGGLIRAVGAAVIAMSLSAISGIEADHLRKADDVALHRRSFVPLFKLLSAASAVLTALATGASFWFFFDGLSALTGFLSGG